MKDKSKLEAGDKRLNSLLKGGRDKTHRSESSNSTLQVSSQQIGIHTLTLSVIFRGKFLTGL